MRMLLEEYDGRVPRRLDELVRLPGVARKTANVVAAELGDPQGVVVDTHVRRLSQRLGLTRHDDPVKIERDLVRLVPRAKWGIFPHLLIWHGRRVCVARSPALRGVRARRSLPGEPARLARSERDEQAAVLVVGGEEVERDRLARARRGSQLGLLVELPHAPLERGRHGALAVLEPVEPERLDDLAIPSARTPCSP